MHSVIYGIISALGILCGVLCCVLYFRRRQRSDLVCDNSAFFLMVLSCVGLGILSFWLIFNGESELALIPAAVDLLCLLGLASWHNEVICFDEEGFTRRDILLRTTRHSYADITDCGERILRQSRKRQEVQTLFYLGKKRFSLSRKAANYVEFARRVRKYGAVNLDL